MTERYHCDACGWDGETPDTHQEPWGEGLKGWTWTLRVCPTCGAEVYATIISPAPVPQVGPYRCPTCGPLTRAAIAHREVDEVCRLFCRRCGAECTWEG
jgi:hypothetical protein